MTQFDNGFDIGEVPADIITFDGAREGSTYQLLTLSWECMCIHDPRYDENGFSPVDPSNYDMTEEQVALFVKTNEALIRTQNKLYDDMSDQINTGCERIQRALGVTTGDTAGSFFSSGENDVEAQVAKLSKNFAQYAVQEFSSIVDSQREANRVRPS